MPLQEITFSVTTADAGGYEISFRAGSPESRKRALKGPDRIPPDAFQPGGLLNPDEVARMMGDRNHTLNDVQTIGERIGQVFLSGLAGKAWLKERDRVFKEHQEWRAAPDDSPEPVLRTYLSIEPEELQVLPWESCRWKKEGLFFHRAFPVIRTVAGNFFKPSPLAEWPVRVLIVAGSRDPNLMALEELRIIRRFLHTHAQTFDIEVFDCEAQTAPPGQPLRLDELLKQKLREFRPHILHFAGHAWFQPAALELRSVTRESQNAVETVTSQKWTADDIGGFFGAQTWQLKLAFLNACRTQKIASAGDSFARAFLARGGALAMIAMSGNVSGDEAGECAIRVYEALAEGRSVDRAVGEARANVGAGRLAAYYPVFTTNASPDRLIFATTMPAPAKMGILNSLSDREPVKQFVDRVAPRRELFTKLASGSNAIAVVGDRDNGKTWFLTSCFRCLAWRGYPVIYVNLTAHTTWNSVLRSLLNGGDEQGLAPELRDDDRLRVIQMIGDSTAPVDLTTTGLLPSVIEKTLEALRPAADQKPLILILDHLEPSDARRSIAADLDNVFAYFFHSTARGDGRIRLILSCGNNAVLSGQTLTGSSAKIDLKPFPAQEVSELMRDWFLAFDPQLVPRVEPYLRAPVNQPQKPRDFAAFCELLKGRV